MQLLREYKAHFSHRKGYQSINKQSTWWKISGWVTEGEMLDQTRTDVCRV